MSEKIAQMTLQDIFSNIENATVTLRDSLFLGGRLLYSRFSNKNKPNDLDYR